MKIRPQFLPLLKEGVKKNEYRLASPKYSNIHVGDILCLINNQNKEEFVKVVVNKIFVYKTWDEAFENRWEGDFRGLYSTYDELVKECHKFYSKDEIDKFGIEVFEIKLCKPKELKGARFLFDTNIIVERESLTNVKDEAALMFKAIDKINGQLFYHPKTRDELSKYSDQKIKSSMLSKLNAYNELNPSSESSNDFFDVCNKYGLDENSKIDNELLLQAFNGRVDYLITEDQAILRKAKELLIRDSVLSCHELLTIFEEKNPKLIDYDVLSVKLEKIGNLNFHDKFFDTLREDYGGSDFNAWLERKSNDDAYVFKNKDGLQGFLYLKSEDETEDYSDFEPTFSPKKRLKIGTFKINSTGIRLGERFLKIIFDNALKMGVDEVYVTLFEHKREDVARLKSQMEEWGFIKTAVSRKTGEIVLVKNMQEYDYCKSPKFNFPLYDLKHGIGILPITAKYHTKMFPDLHLNNEELSMFNEACSYAIEKIYVCGSMNVIHKPGTVLCIYRMADYNKQYRSVITGVAILSEVKYANSVDDLVKECKNRSVFTTEELESFYKVRGYKTIIKVLFLNPFDKKVNLMNLKEYHIVNEDTGPTLRAKIDEQKFNMLLNLGMEETKFEK